MADTFTLLIPQVWQAGLAGWPAYIQLQSVNTGLNYVSVAPASPGGRAYFLDIPNGLYLAYTGPSATGPWTSTNDSGIYVSKVSGGSTGVDLAVRSLTVLPSSPYTPSSSAGSTNNLFWLPPPSGTDDTTAVNSVLTTAAAVTGGAIVQAWPGTYRTPSGFTTPAQSTGFLSIRGAGKYATTFLATNAAVNNTFALAMPGEVTDCTVDGGALASNGLAMKTAGTIAITEMAARRVRCRNVAATGLWVLIVWDTAQIWQIDRCYLDDVMLEGPTNLSQDAFAVSFIKKCYVKNMHMVGLGRTPNFFYILDLELDGLTVENSMGATDGLVFDAGVQHMSASRIRTDGSCLTRIKAQEAHFSDCTFLAAVRCGLATFPTNAEFHNCHIQANGASALDTAALEVDDVGCHVKVFGGTISENTSSTGAVSIGTAANSTLSGLELHGVTLDVPNSLNVCKGLNNPITLTNMLMDNCRGFSPGRTAGDCTLTQGSAIVTSSQEGQFFSTDVGRTITGPNIPAATTVASVQSLTQLTMSANVSAGGTQTNQSVVLGDKPVSSLGFQFSTPDSTCRFHDNVGYNPVGNEVVAVPASTVAVAAVPYDRYYWISTGAGATSIQIQNGPSITLAASTAGQLIFVPAGKTMTPTYANAPTWVTEGN